MKTCTRALRVGRRFTFQQDNDPKHTTKTTQEWLWDNSLNVHEWPRQSLDVNQIEHLWRDVKIAVQRCSPSNLTEFERVCREEIQVYQACRVIPMKTSGCKSCQRCFNKVLRKGYEYLCKYDISLFFFYIYFQKCLKNSFCFVILGYCKPIKKNQF